MILDFLTKMKPCKGIYAMKSGIVLSLPFSKEANKNYHLILSNIHKMANWSFCHCFLARKIFPLLKSKAARIASIHLEESLFSFSFANE